MATSAWDINWPVAIVMCVAIIAVSALAFAQIIPKEIITNIVLFLLGVAIPSRPLATRVKTYYSDMPPPTRVISDRPEPDERHGA